MRPLLLFALGLAVWAGCFVLISQLGTWAPLAALGPLLALWALRSDANARLLVRPEGRLLAIGLVGGLVMTAATYALFALATRLEPSVGALTQALYVTLRAPSFSPLARGLLIPLVAAAEEVVFRGTVLSGGTRPALRAVAVSSILLGVAHLASGSWLLALVAALSGAAWGGLRVATRSCVPSIVTHVLWDLAILVVRPLA